MIINEILGSVRELIEYGSLDEAKTGLREVAKLEPDISMPFLYSIFSDKPYQLCDEAANILISMGNSSISYIKNLYESANENQKFWTIRILIHGGADSYEFLSQLVNRENEELCAFLASQLNQVINNKYALPLLIKLLKNKSWLVKKNAAASLVKIGPKAVPHLKKLFSTKNRDLRYWVIKILGKTLKNDFFPFLEKMIKDNPDNLGYYALIGLDELNSKKSIDLLVSTLGHKNWLLRAESAEILKRKGKAIVSTLKAHFKKNNVVQQYWIILLIAEILGEQSLVFLEDILKHHKIELRHYAVSALGCIDSPRSINLLIDALADRAWIVRKHAAKTLKQFGSSALPAIQLGVSDLRDDVAYWCVRIISELSNWDISMFFSLLEHPDKKRRAFAIQQAACLNNHQVIDKIASMLNDSSWSIRKEAADTLIKFKEKGIDAVFKKLLENNGSKHISYWSLYIIKNSNIEIAEKYLAKYLKPNNTDKELKLAIRLLSSIPNENTWQLIINTYISPDQFFRKRLREIIIEEKLFCLVKPFLKALKRAKPDIALEICDILASSPELEKFKLIREEFLKSSEDQATWLIRILVNSNHPAKYQFLSDILSREHRKSVKKEAYLYFGSQKDKALFSVIFDIFMKSSEEERQEILDSYRGIPDEEMVKKMFTSLRESHKQDAFWIAKMLNKYYRTHEKLFHQILRTPDPELKVWKKEIIS